MACDHAWLGDRMAHDTWLGIGADGTITELVQEPPERPDAPVQRVAGVTLPGLVDTHGHAFHRHLRGRAQPDGVGDGSPRGARDDFWRWRERMYAVARTLDPDGMFAIARAVYGEMALAGITCVGEFHYVHHQPDGTPYADPNAMGRAVVAAADEVGIRLTLLDTLYLTGRVGATLDDPDLDDVQRRFSDGDAHRWATRVADLSETATTRLGAAIHSVRAVPPEAIADVAALAVGTDAGSVRVLHAHVAEQVAEGEATRAVHGRSPTRLLADAGALSERFTAVHGVWLDDDDRALLGDAGATVCACPTTEQDLADGIVDGAALADAGVRLALGSDQHVVVDLFAEARGLELGQRLATRTRGHHDPAALLAAATTGGAHSLGWPELGRLEVGAPADLAVVATGSVRLVGIPDDDLASALVFAATAADVTATMVAGQWIVRDGAHVRRDVGDDLRRALDVDLAGGHR
nr:formimidoylglutamate deiminase [Salsipaludibacter albus]